MITWSLKNPLQNLRVNICLLKFEAIPLKMNSTCTDVVDWEEPGTRLSSSQGNKVKTLTEEAAWSAAQVLSL